MVGGLARAADRLGGAVEKVTGAVCVACLAAMTVVVLVGVFFRYALNDPFMWTEEAARYLQVWMGFLAVSIALRRGKHIRVEVLAPLLRPWLAKVLDILVDGIMAWFMVILLHQGYLLVVNSLSRASTLPLSMVWILSAVPAAAGLSLVQLAVNVIKKLLPAGPARPETDGPAEAGGRQPEPQA